MIIVRYEVGDDTMDQLRRLAEQANIAVSELAKKDKHTRYEINSVVNGVGCFGHEIRKLLLNAFNSGVLYARSEIEAELEL